MADFLENLWNSIFVAGTTPTLLIATNLTFAALQLVLGVLLAATRSIHFLVLSVLCAGLWWSINWFAAELRKAERTEEETKRLRRQRTTGSMAENNKPDLSRGSGDESTATETEVEYKPLFVRGGPEKAQAVLSSAAEAEADRQRYSHEQSVIRTRGGPAKAQAVQDSSEVSREPNIDVAARQARACDATAEGMSSGVFIRGVPDKIPAVLNIGEQSQSSTTPQATHESGSVSTDSEWEKVSDH